MNLSSCNQECSYFRWTETGANFKGYCMKKSLLIKEVQRCPLLKISTVENNGVVM